MPELPEVETVCRGLANTISGTTIKKLQLRRKNLRMPFPDGFAEIIDNTRIISISRRAKYLLFALDNSMTLIAHLGMTGRFSVEATPLKKYHIHDHVVMTLDDGRVVIYHDPRRFGLMALTKTCDAATHPLLAHLGVEPLSGDFSSTYLRGKLSTRKAPIKPVLMDQTLVVGVGNIYASEALFLTGIHPQMPASKAAEKATQLVPAIQKVLQSAIESGGSSLRDFVQLSGESGYFQHHFNVYGRAGEPCYICKTPISSIRQAGRSSFFCASCQKPSAPCG